MELAQETQALAVGHGQLRQLASPVRQVAKLIPRTNGWN